MYSHVQWCLVPGRCPVTAMAQEIPATVVTGEVGVGAVPPTPAPYTHARTRTHARAGPTPLAFRNVHLLGHQLCVFFYDVTFLRIVASGVIICFKSYMFINLCFKNFIYIFTIVFFLCPTLKRPQTTSVEGCESRKRRLPPPCSGSHCRDERWGLLAPCPLEGLLRSLGAGMGSSPRWFASFHQGSCIELRVSSPAGGSGEACAAVGPLVCPFPCLYTKDAGMAGPEATFFRV